MNKSSELDCLVPHFDRLNYFYGQLLSVDDLRTEQAYFREKLKLHNRCLHGYGALCGLRVVPCPSQDEPCPTDTDEERERLEKEIVELERRLAEAAEGQTPEVELERIKALLEARRRALKALIAEDCGPAPVHCLLILPGLGFDAEGNELVVRHPLKVDPWLLLSSDERRRVEAAAARREALSFYVSLCFKEVHIHPTRPALHDGCGVGACTHGRVRDQVCVRVSLERPPEDPRCEPCCACPPPGSSCLLLARVDDYRPARPIAAARIHNHVRRPLGPYPLTHITGISWTHGAEYTVNEARQLMGTLDPRRGFEVRFSRPVLTESFRPGVIELNHFHGGDGVRGVVQFIDVDYRDLDPAEEQSDVLRFRQTSRESLQFGDRVVIRINTPFILDACCKPVDGLHVGGMVSILPEYHAFERPRPSLCETPPGGIGPWHSGYGGSPGVFESWFFVKE